jgi:hypothetical protein
MQIKLLQQLMTAQHRKPIQHRAAPQNYHSSVVE